MEPRKIREPLLAAGLILVFALPLVGAQSIEITSGPAVAPEYTMQVDVTGFDLVDYSSRDSNRDGEGHVHYLVNGEPATDDLAYATPSTQFTFSGLSVGDTVAAQLVNNDHSPLDPTVQADQEVGAGTSGFHAAAAIAAVGLALIAHRRSR